MIIEPGLWTIGTGSVVVVTSVTEAGVVGHSTSGRIPSLLWDVNGKIISETTPHLYDLVAPYKMPR